MPQLCPHQALYGPTPPPDSHRDLSYLIPSLISSLQPLFCFLCSAHDKDSQRIGHTHFFLPIEPHQGLLCEQQRPDDGSAPPTARDHRGGQTRFSTFCRLQAAILHFDTVKRVCLATKILYTLAALASTFTQKTAVVFSANSRDSIMGLLLLVATAYFPSAASCPLPL